jgi:glutathione S-transferase
MKLIGMLDSPFVRRVAITMRLSGVAFEHAAISVFRGFAEFQQINPVVKAPTLVCNDGTLLMDSTLMLEYVEALSGRRLVPREPSSLAQDLRLIGLALAACEKTAQIVYERGLRPAEKRHEPWIERVTGQLQAAYRALDDELAHRPLDATETQLGQAAITVGVAWRFTQFVLPEVVPAALYPQLAAFSLALEALPVFRAIPCDDAVTLPAAN